MVNSFVNRQKNENADSIKKPLNQKRNFSKAAQKLPRNNVFEQSFSSGNATFSHNKFNSSRTNAQLEREAELFSERMINLPQFTAKSQSDSSHSSPQGSDIQKQLPGKNRNQFNKYFGYDFSNVRVQTGSAAARETKQAGARAITTGNTIQFASGEYQPDTLRGRKLLAHELSHIVQQDPAVEGDGLSNAPYGIPQYAEDDGLTVGPFEDLQSERFSGVPELERAYDDKTLIYNGRSGDFVAIIQAALEAFGFPLTKYGIDGIFGSETESKVLEFQKAAGATMLDGIVGPETMNLLDQWALEREKKEKSSFLQMVRNMLTDKTEICILDLYERYLNGEQIKGGIVRSSQMDAYIEKNLGRPGPGFVHPSKYAKPEFYSRLNKYYNKSLENFTQEITDEKRRTVEGFDVITRKNSTQRLARHYSVNKMINYIEKRSKNNSDIYSCFPQDVAYFVKHRIPDWLIL